MKDTTKQRIDEVRFLHLVESASMSAKRAYFNIILPFLRERQIQFDDECDPCRLRIAVGDDELRIYETCQVLRIFAEGEQVVIEILRPDGAKEQYPLIDEPLETVRQCIERSLWEITEPELPF